MTKSQEPSGPVSPALHQAHGPITKTVVAIVMAASRARFLVLALAAILTVYCGYYAATHFAINTNTDEFIDAKVPWRQDQIAYNKAFPLQNDQIIVVVDGVTPERAEEAVTALEARLQGHPDLFKLVVRPDGGPFFDKNGLLYLPLKDLRKTVNELQSAEPVLAILTSDPSLRGLMDSYQFISKGVLSQKGTLDDYDAPIAALNHAIEGILADKPTFFSLQSLLNKGAAASTRQTRKFIEITPVLDYSALEPGEKPSDFIRQAAADLHLTQATGARVRLTGEVPLADDEFSTVSDGAGLNGAITAIVVLLIIWTALKSLKIVLAVFLTVLAGLAMTFAAGLFLVGALNLISVAFAVLFVGIGVDFGIQFSVRYRAERYDEPDFSRALHNGAAKVGRPLALAAVATTVGFYAFLPTQYRGVSELGEIAGTGMIIAFLSSITILPALLTIIRPAAEREPVGYKFLAPVDDFLHDHRYAVIIGTLAVALAGTPLLRNLQFDFNPMNLDSPKVESVSTVLDLMKDPDTDTQVINVLQPNLAAADALAAKIGALPDVARVTTLSSLVPDDQDAKLALIQKAKTTIDPVFDPTRVIDPPADAEDAQALHKAGIVFVMTAGQHLGKGADDARHFADLAQKLSEAAPAVRQRAREVLLPPVKATLASLKNALDASQVTIETLPAPLRDLYMTADGRARIEAAPKGDPNDNDNMINFAQSIKTLAPHATGEPVAVQEAGRTVKLAFVEAAIVALTSIFIILWIVLRRIGDVLLTLVPLLLAGVVTLEITVLIGMPLNFANIIALPLLLGLGVAFKIYFVMAWRAGTTKLLQSSLTRAVFWSALTTATAFGSLWASKHPGTSSMGKLMALSLLCTLAAAILFQPALMGPPRETEVK
jgi:hopanoid biosynthesis associated RND transporter like protein HpnN